MRVHKDLVQKTVHGKSFLYNSDVSAVLRFKVMHSESFGHFECQWSAVTGQFEAQKYLDGSSQFHLQSTSLLVFGLAGN